MNIGQGNYQILTPQQARPVSSSLQEGLQRYLSRQKIQQNQMQMPFIVPNAEAGLQQKQLANQYYGPNMQSQIGLRGAQTQDAQQGAIKQAILNSFLPQSEQARIGQTGAMTNYYNSGGPGMGVGQKQIMGLKRQLASEHPDWSPSKVDESASDYLSGQNQMSDGTPLPNPSGIVRKMLDQITLKSNTAMGANQQRFAATLDTAFKHADQNAPGAFRFAGLAGKMKGGVDAASASVGANDPDYQDFLNFTQQDIPAVATELLRTGGASSTDKQKLMALQQANPIAWNKNPKLAMEQWKYLQSLYKEIGKAISASPSQIQTNLQQGNGANVRSSSSQQSRQQTQQPIVSAVWQNGKLVRQS